MKAHFLMFAHYNAWANRRLYAAAGALADADRRRDAGAFFGSLHATLNHLLVTDVIWLARLRSIQGPPWGLDHIAHDDFADLTAAREALAASDGDAVADARAKLSAYEYLHKSGRRSVIDRIRYHDSFVDRCADPTKLTTSSPVDASELDACKSAMLAVFLERDHLRSLDRHGVHDGHCGLLALCDRRRLLLQAQALRRACDLHTLDLQSNNNIREVSGLAGREAELHYASPESAVIAADRDLLLQKALQAVRR